MYALAIAMHICLLNSQRIITWAGLHTSGSRYHAGHIIITNHLYRPHAQYDRNKYVSTCRKTSILFYYRPHY